MKRFTPISIIISLVLLGSLAFSLSLTTSAVAAPVAQFTPYPTPTPGQDGRIIYIAQKNDSWWRIAAIFGINLNQLYKLNNAGPDTILTEGKEIVLGFGGPSEAQPTAGPSPTPTPALPTSTPQPGSGSLCVFVFNDVNGDATLQDNEIAIAGAAISLSDRTGKTSLTKTTSDSPDPNCFQEIPQGDYNVSVAVPEGYNPTTVMNYALVVSPGSETFMDFGAQTSAVAPPAEVAPTGNRSLMLGLFGAMFVLGGIALAVYAALIGRSRSKRAEES